MQLSEIIDDVDIVYLASHIDEAEKIKIYQLVTKKEKKLFLNTTFENLDTINPNIMNFEDESIIERLGLESHLNMHCSSVFLISLFH